MVEVFADIHLEKPAKPPHMSRRPRKCRQSTFAFPAGITIRIKLLVEERFAVIHHGMMHNTFRKRGGMDGSFLWIMNSELRERTGR